MITRQALADLAEVIAHERASGKDIPPGNIMMLSQGRQLRLSDINAEEISLAAPFQGRSTAATTSAPDGTQVSQGGYLANRKLLDFNDMSR